MHKIEDEFDLVIHDEHHRFGSFPKPSKGTKLFRDSFGHLPMIFLSGTPHPESFSQIYHQFWVSNRSPFKQWTNFYKWANDFVIKKQKHLGHGIVNDYSEAIIEKIQPYIEPMMITFTQKQAGFETNVVENVLTVKMSDQTYAMCDRLKKDLVIEGSNEVILADTGVKLMSKLHQMYSGTVKFESGSRMVLDYSKARFIIERFGSDKIAIFYKFTAEFYMLKEVLGDRLTQDISEFNSDPNKWIALQIISGREGTNLSSADFLLYLNIDFSAVSYWQSRDRLTTMDRKENDLFWIFSEGGIESKIYKTVQGKKDFTLSVFKKECL
jgi:DNA-binding transcriptional regulator YiaG